MFNKNSMVVRAWVDMINEGERTIEEVPKLSNLIDVVKSIVEGVE